MDTSTLDSISDKINLKNLISPGFLVGVAIFKSTKFVRENNVNILQKVFIL